MPLNKNSKGRKLVFVVGMAGAGKSAVSDELMKKGFAFLRFGQLTLDEAKKRGVSGEAEEKKIREEIREKHGKAAFAVLNIPKIDELLQTSDVVVDGLYSWSEYKVLKEKYSSLMRVVAIFAPPEIRYERLASRKVEKDTDLRFRPFTKEEAMSRDFAEIENIEKGGPIAMADFTIINMGSFNDLKKDIDKVLSEI